MVAERQSQTPAARNKLHRLSRAIRILAAALLVASTAGCFSRADDGSSLAALRAMPEDRLFYPGSVQLGDHSRRRRHTFEGRFGAASGHRLGSQDGATKIEAWYDQELAKRGWVPANVSSGFAATTESTARAWQKGAVIFRFSVLLKDHPLSPPRDVVAKYETIFEIRLIESLR